VPVDSSAKFKNMGECPMQITRCIRKSVPVLMLGPLGFLLGCSGQPNSTPVDKEAGKSIASDVKASRQEMKSQRSQAKGGRMAKSPESDASGP
jgi:hypothetical protein